MLEKIFKLKEHDTNVQTEVLGGVVTFITMVYVLAVAPSMLSDAGMDRSAVLIASALAAFAGTLIMGLFANYPFALAPGIGSIAYFTYTACGTMGYSWQVSLMAIFIEGIIFVILSVTNVREAIFDAIPHSLKIGISAGVGLFIAFIGMQGSHLVVANHRTLVSYVNFHENFHTIGISALLALIGLMTIVILYQKNVNGSILIGILVSWVLGMLCQKIGLYVPDEAAGFASLYPHLSWPDLSALKETFGQFAKADFSGVRIGDFIVVVFAFLFVDMFDTIGTLIGVATKADMLDEDGKLPGIKKVLLSDALATTVGAVLGTVTTTSYVESTAGVGAGARTGLASVVTALLFLVSIILAPIFCALPGFATGPALIFVGFLMLSSVIRIDFEDLTEAVPAYLSILAMPLMYSIAEGITIGVISYVVINLACGKAKKITPLMYALAVLFVIKYIFI